MSDENKIAADYLSEAADTYRERRKVYGDNYLTVGRAMVAFFPDGIKLKTEDDHNRFHIFMLKIVKLTRYAVNWDRGGHADSLLDDAVYCSMLMEIDANINRENDILLSMMADGEEDARKETVEAHVDPRDPPIAKGQPVTLYMTDEDAAQVQALAEANRAKQPSGIVVDRIEETADWFANADPKTKFGE